MNWKARLSLGFLALGLACASESTESAGSAGAAGSDDGGAGTAGTGGGAGTSGSGGAAGQAADGGQDAGPLDPIWLEYAANPDRHPNIPNCSYAGYHHGEDPLPDGTGLAQIDVRDHGAVADDGADDTDAVYAALAAVPASGGVVTFPAGRFQISRPIFVTKSNLILRGATRDSTILHFTKPLHDFYDLLTNPADANSSTQWSWLGGLVWFEPLGGETNTNVNLPQGNAQSGYKVREYWPRSEADLPLMPAQRGDRTLTFAGATPSWLKAGVTAVLRVKDDAQHRLLVQLSGDNPWAEKWQADDQNHVIHGTYVDVPLEIDSVESGRIHLRQPLRFDLRAEWQPILNRLSRAIRESGIQRMTLEMSRTYAWTFGGTHHHEEGWNGVYFNTALDCFASDLRILNGDHGVSVATSKNVSVDGVSIDYDRKRPELASQHHAFAVRGGSHDTLLRQLGIASRVFHGLNVEALSMGNVWTESRLERGSFDSHRRLPLENCRTEITLVSAGGQAGGEDKSGPLNGARTVHWNVEVEGPADIGDLFRGELIADPRRLPSGAIVGVRGLSVPFVDDSKGSVNYDYDLLPDSGCILAGNGASAPNPPNLYRAQLALRLGKTP